jgi:hypothetical protein
MATEPGLQSAGEILDRYLVDENHRLTAEVETGRARIEALLKHAGAPSHCKGCAALIFWVRHIDNGKSAPYDLDGQNHFASCGRAEEFRRKRPHGAA